MTKFGVSGDVCLTKHGHKRCMTHLKFKHSLKDIPLQATFMSSFSDLDLTNEEKTKLTQDYRKEMRAYQHVDQKKVNEGKKELISILKKLRDEKIKVTARDFGAFIALAAIFSGDLPQNVDWRFELEEFALPLFPEKYIKNKTACQNFDISLKFSSNHWLRLFPSLKKVPTFMGTQFDPDIELFRHSA